MKWEKSLRDGVSGANYSIKQKLKDAKRKAKVFLDSTRKLTSAEDYRGYGKVNKKDIASQVQWLFWHITPPYLSAAEISATTEDVNGHVVDLFYIQRCYQKMAKLLGIKLIKG